jgi:lipopolysaccharide/colanic/teichoic acid biosynthesis glycosyltransferase
VSASRRVRLAIKRLLDVTASALLVVTLSPVLLVVSLIVMVGVGRPVIFRQQRLGRHGRVFEIMKFRTMTDERDRDGTLLPDDARLTPVGRFLRASSLDEIPELVNVLLGDMSLVGPRPLLASYRDLYTPFESRRHAMRPGIAGPVTIAGRNAITWEEKFALDSAYINNWSLSHDLKILALTVWKALTREGVSPNEGETMPLFRGSPKPDSSHQDR